MFVWTIVQSDILQALLCIENFNFWDKKSFNYLLVLLEMEVRKVTLLQLVLKLIFGLFAKKLGLVALS